MSSPANTTAESDHQLTVIGLGANQASTAGAPEDTLAAVLADLQALSRQQLAVSGFYHTSPENCPPGSPDFVNAVALLYLPGTTDPMQLLRELQALETKYGRQRHPSSPANAPRPLDLDLIAFGDRQMQEPELQLPHPRAAGRRFVLEPLAELVPDYCLPGMDVSVQQLLTGLGQE